MSNAKGLQVRGLTVRYDKALALDQENFDAAPSAITLLVGPNGAGKSSCPNAIYRGVASSGQVLLDSVDIIRMSAGAAEMGTALDLFPILRERAHLLAGVLSGGEQQMVAVSRTPISKPRVLLLDEVVTGPWHRWWRAAWSRRRCSWLPRTSWWSLPNWRSARCASECSRAS